MSILYACQVIRQHTLADHADIEREYTYTFEELGEGKSHNLP